VATVISFFPVDNGDMTLIRLDDGRTILIDVRIREAADDSENDTPDVGKELRKRLKKDENGRHFVDAFCLTHPDEDHCLGLEKHFHLGDPDEFAEKSDKIFIREIWSSPIVFRRASADHTLCDDARAFNAEARRRVKKYRDSGSSVGDGNRIQVLGEDIDGKTDDLSSILVKVDELIKKINGNAEEWMEARLLGPLSHAGDEVEEETLTKNQSSVALRFSFTAGGKSDAGLFLIGGDADVAIWERHWNRLKEDHKDWLQYDLMLTPHHCSWHTLSNDSWSDKGEDAQVSEDAKQALGQARSGAIVIASSKPISDDDSDPPCVRAKREYMAITKNVGGRFLCVGELPSTEKPGVLEIEITSDGVRVKRSPSTPAIGGGGAIGGQPLTHGSGRSRRHD